MMREELPGPQTTVAMPTCTKSPLAVLKASAMEPISNARNRAQSLSGSGGVEYPKQYLDWLFGLIA
jgi:hypothetical protein